MACSAWWWLERSLVVAGTLIITRPKKRPQVMNPSVGTGE
jgi:hypothetical protein